MREIKFRAWDEKHKRIVKEGDLLDAYNCPTIPTPYGFKLRTTSEHDNESANIFIYMAFAENPFVTSGGVAGLAR